TAASLSPTGCLFFLFFPLTLYYLGRLVLPLLRLDPELGADFGLVFLTGALLAPLILFLAHSLLPNLLPLSLGLAALVGLLQYLCRPEPGPSEKTCKRDILEPAVVLLSLLAATFWARGLLRSVVVGETEVRYNNWVDSFNHASIMSCLTTNHTLWELGNYELSTEPPIFYHYTTYLYPALLTRAERVTAYQAILGLWIPLGTFLSGLGAYAFGLLCFGRKAGFCAAAAVLLLPDPAYTWPGHPWFSYHWMQQIL